MRFTLGWGVVREYLTVSVLIPAVFSFCFCFVCLFVCLSVFFFLFSSGSWLFAVRFAVDTGILWNFLCMVVFVGPSERNDAAYKMVEDALARAPNVRPRILFCSTLYMCFASTLKSGTLVHVLSITFLCRCVSLLVCLLFFFLEHYISFCVVVCLFLCVSYSSSLLARQPHCWLRLRQARIQDR